MMISDKEPIIMDFGVAKNCDLEFSTLCILGTPNYMSPEQAQGKKLDIHSDIFSLGIIFYEMLAGRLPFVGNNDFEVFTNIVYEDPVSPKVVQPTIPQNLDTICLKCLEKDSSKRYSSALELAQDIERFLNNETILAKPLNNLEKLIKWMQRHKLATTIGLFSTVSIFFIKSLHLFNQRFCRRKSQSCL